MKSPDRWLGWWRFAEEAAARLTTPAPDVNRSDAEVEQLLRGSSIFAILRAAAAKTGRAWNDSRTARWLSPIARDLAPGTTVDRLRVAGLVAAIGSVTAMALLATGPARARWFDAIVPVGVAVVGAFVVAAARPLARALEDTRR